MNIGLPETLPPACSFFEGIRRAPRRELRLNDRQIALALKNALRYIPANLHLKIAPEFLVELRTKGRIYGYRYRPQGVIKAKPIDEYKGRTTAGKALQLMIDNNLDCDVALYPYELVTYGESGQVCQNWMQYRLIKQYLEELDDDHTLVVNSGHPLGLFPSRPEAPRAIVTNGLMVGLFDNPDDFNIAAALGVTNYGQMTAGGWMYIGPQGIVHGTYITLLNAGRKFLALDSSGDLRGKLFVSSGLGGMSGAQAKAIEIAGGVGIIAEVDLSRIDTRLRQGWVQRMSADLDEIVTWAIEAQAKKEQISLAYHGNIVDLLDYLVKKGIRPDLLSDQTSCHAAYEGGYTPSGYDFSEGRTLLENDSAAFRSAVDRSLGKHFALIEDLVDRGSYFFDYGNSFMKAVYDAGHKRIAKNGSDTSDGFLFPSYVEDIMGPLCFDKGYGPFRWVCLSGNDNDLTKTDKAALACIDPENSPLDRDNYTWIRNAAKNNLVVGSKARILYADAQTRAEIAANFNRMIRENAIGPVMIGRDHHDVSGTDSPFRETANIRDGSNICADMSIQCFAGNIARGMTLVVQSNGGGVGIGKSKNSGFGLILDGSEKTDAVIASALNWDVVCGIARRSWAQNDNAMVTAKDWNNKQGGIARITMPFSADEAMIAELLSTAGLR